jgi:hypothetical protein
VTAEELTADDHTLTQQLGRRLYDACTTALYPRFSIRRDGRVSIHATPAQGTNLLITRITSDRATRIQRSSGSPALRAGFDADGC